jgi:uncharacterized membrane protein YfcA
MHPLIAMITLEPVQYVLGAFSGSLVGLTLGLFGGGGSILAVPLMVYLVSVPEPHGRSPGPSSAPHLSCGLQLAETSPCA